MPNRSPPDSSRRHPLGFLLGQMSRRAFGLLTVRAAMMLTSLAISVILARVLGVEEFGIYNYAFAIVALVGLPLNEGVPKLVTRLVSTYHLQERNALLSGLLRRASQLALIGGLALALTTASIILLVGPRANITQVTPFLISLAVLPLGAVTAVRTAALSGFGRVIAGEVCQLLVRPALLCCLLAAVAVMTVPLNASVAVTLRVVAVAVAALAATQLLRKRNPPAATPEFDTREWIGRALPLVLLGGLQILTQRADILMLGALAGPDAVGIYAPANQGSGLVLVGLMILNSAIAPTVARFHAAGKRIELQRLVRWTSRCAFGWALPVATLMAILGASLLEWLYGRAYVGGALPLSILSAAQLINAAVGPVGLLLTMTGHERVAARGVMVAAVVNVALNAWLIPSHGVAGAAVATAISILLWNLLLAASVRKRLGLDPTIAGRPAAEGTQWR